MAFGGLGVIMLRANSALWSFDMALRKADVQSLFFATMFAIIVLVLAYLTNPSETSFRAYLTEQSFRQHLSRLDDAAHEDDTDSEDSGVHFTSSRPPRAAAALHKLARSPDAVGAPYHFVNRVSVSLRTPKHVFHSFGILTIAAVVPNGRPQAHAGNNANNVAADATGSMISNSWFVGAFGRWWRGGAIQSWWIDADTHVKDAERCGSGILDVKTLDSLEGYDDLSFSVPTPAAHLPPNVRDSPPKLRGTERPAQRTPSTNTPRSTTPPPLPKSASLPLHAPRVPTSSSSSTPAKGDKAPGQRHTQSPPQASPTAPSTSPDQPSRTAIASPPPVQPSPSSASLFNDPPQSQSQSPVISELLRQISQSKSAVLDLRTQLTEFRSAAADSHAAIQSDLDAHRERKRSEDASRAEVKARTKTLDDSKRSAEAHKRDAEKRLRAAESARDNASERIGRLGREIGELRARMGEDERAVERCMEEGDKAERAMAEELEMKKKEIKVAEDVVAALNARAKEMEAKIAAAEEGLKRAKELAELRKQDLAFSPLHVPSSNQEPVPATPWSPVALNPADHSPVQPQDPHLAISTDRSAHIEVFPQFPFPTTRSRGASTSSAPRDSLQVAASPRPRKLSLGGISNFREKAHPVVRENTQAQVAIQPIGYPVFGDSINSMSSARSYVSRFSPFGDSEVEVPVGGMLNGDVPSPKSSSLIPTSLIQSIEGGASSEDLARSFQSDSDAVLDRDWRKLHPFPAQPVENPALFNSSPTSFTCPSFDGVDHEDPFEIRPPPPLRQRLSNDSFDMQQHTTAVSPLPYRASSDPQTFTRSRAESDVDGDKAAMGHRRWFSSPREPKEKKGLNPEAKVFQLKKSFPAFGSSSGSSSSAGGPFSTTTTTTVTTMDNNNLAPPSASYSVPSMLPPLSSASDSSSFGSLFSTLSMRAFAPSPAEREALTRALGSSTNTSLERLPTLSEVSIASMPSSPSHVHAHAHAHALGNGHGHGHGIAASPASSSMGEVGSRMPPGLAWLQSLPRMRKPKFSPWEDEGEGDGR